jgi:hypothetical protein
MDRSRLANVRRVHVQPRASDGKGDVGPLRAKVATVAASAIEDTPIEKYKQAEAEYNAAVVAQIPKFRTGVQASLSATPQSGVPAQRERDNVRFSAGAGSINPPPKVFFGPVLNGIDVLEKNNFKELEGKRIGLVTNHTVETSRGSRRSMFSSKQRM